MGNQNDDIDKIKQNWAYNLPCVLLVNQGKIYWETKVKDIYKVLYKEIILGTRKTLSASMIEVMKLIEMDSESN